MVRFFSIALLFLSLQLTAQKQITLADIYQKGIFSGEFVNTSFKTNDTKATLPTGFSYNGKSIGKTSDIITAENNKNFSIIKTEKESIYRRSSKSFAYLYNAADKKTSRIADEKVLHATFSPDGKKIAYVKDNDLYLYDIATGKTTAITKDGKWNYIINGNCDWVYEEEFEFSQAYQWSPDGSHIAYYRFDESKVKEYSFTEYDNNYNSQYTYKYPKAGETIQKLKYIFTMCPQVKM